MKAQDERRSRAASKGWETRRWNKLSSEEKARWFASVVQANLWEYFKKFRPNSNAIS